MKYKTHILSKANLIEPKSESRKAIASSLKDKYGFDLKPQMDLLYLQSCLVSAGAKAGVNDNDDIFTRDEAWQARHTPVLKPFNWQHQDKDIIGVIYTVQARDLNGNVLDINQEQVPDCDFDLWTEAVIFRMIHPDRARDVEARAKAKDLFVSMEAWFDDYGYGLYTNTGLAKVVARNESTVFLDKHLRASGGAGKYRDPESGQEMRIGRVLRSITFGGCGLVDHPANKRSVITSVEEFQNINNQDEVELLLQRVLESEVNPLQELAVMNTQANVQPDVKTAINSALDEREQAAAKAAAEKALQARAAAAEASSEELEAKNAELSKALEAKNAEVKSLNDQTAAYNEAVKKLVEEHVAATAGATNDTPSEISKIDAAKTGEAAFQAKIAWIQQSLAGLRSRAARATELENKLAEAEAVVREQDVRSLLGEIMSEEAVETFVAHAATLDSEAYTHWRDEKELMVIEMARAAKKVAPDAEDAAEDKKPDAPFPPKKGAKKGKAEEQNPFAVLLAKYRTESEADPDTSKVTNGDPLINFPAGPGINSGVNPGQLRTPRNKIAGSAAGNDPSKALESAKVKNGVSLAGANQAGSEGESVNPFRVLAGLVTDSKQESEDNEVEPKAKKPGFDPVQ